MNDFAYNLGVELYKQALATGIPSIGPMQSTQGVGMRGLTGMGGIGLGNKPAGTKPISMPIKPMTNPAKGLNQSTTKIM